MERMLLESLDCGCEAFDECPLIEGAERPLDVFEDRAGADEARARGLARRGGNGPAHAQARRCAVPDPNLERVDSFASSLQPVEDPAGVGEGTFVAAAEPDQRQHPGEELSGVRPYRHRAR